MSRYKPDHGPKGLGGFLLSAQLLKPVLEVAHDIAEDAKENSPRSEGDGPHMADQFKVTPGAVITVAGNPRVSAEVTNDDPAAAPNEFGGSRNKPRRMLGRAGAKYGDHHGKRAL